MAPRITELVEKNRLYSDTKHQPKPYLSEFANPPPAPTVFVFSCLDFRAQAWELLDLSPGEVHLVQNLGGRVKDSLNALLYLDVLTKGQIIKEVAIIHHTDCGITHSTETEVHEALKARAPELASEIDQFEFFTYDGSSLDKHKETVRADIKFLKSSPLIRDDLKKAVYGYVYDIKTGKLDPVV